MKYILHKLAEHKEGLGRFYLAYIYEVNGTEFNCVFYKTKERREWMKSDNDKPLFRFKTDAKGVARLSMTEREFEKVWGELPYTIANEMIECNDKQNPQWTPMGNE